MQSNRCEQHNARNLAHASCGAKGHAKILLNCQQIPQPSSTSPAGLVYKEQWEPPRLAEFRAIIPHAPTRDCPLNTSRPATHLSLSPRPPHKLPRLLTPST